jgi:hypothetical protein
MFGKMDLENREFDASFEQARDDFAETFRGAGGGELGDRLEPLRETPYAIEVLRQALEERVERSTIDLETLTAIHRGVEAALPDSAEQASGFHPRPSDPLEAFVFVGTRYPARITPEMIDALRERRYGDLGILDLAIAIADANQWARVRRLLGLDPALFSLAGVAEPQPLRRDQAASA